MDLHIRRTRKDDIPAISKVIREVHPAFISEDLAQETARDLRDGNCVPELALTAVSEGLVVGHIHFVEQDIYCGNHCLRGIELWLISVGKAFQRRGIGRALIAKGHENALSLGYEASIVYGWEEYYPRFGYRPMFGAPHLCVPAERMPSPMPALSGRALEESDIPHLKAIWKNGNVSVPLAVAPPDNMVFWQDNDVFVFCPSQNPTEILGFIVCDDNKKDVYSFESKDHDTALAMLSFLVEKRFTSEDGRIDLPLHPLHRVSSELDRIVASRTFPKMDSLMACNLSSNQLDAISDSIDKNSNMLGTYWTPRNEWVT